MKGLSAWKKSLLKFYAGYDTYLTAACRFAIAFLTLSVICRMGYMAPLEQIPLLVILAGFCSFLPSNILLLAAAVYLEGELYGCSPEAAAVGGLSILLFFLLYYTFIPGQTYAVLLTVLCLGLKIPLVVSVVCGLLCGPGSLLGILFGTVMYYLTGYLAQKPETAAALGPELLNRILDLLRGMFRQPELILMLVTFCAVFFAVYLLRRLPVKYSWQIGAGAGILVYAVLLMMGGWMPGVKISLQPLILDLLLAAAAGIILPFFCFRLDYRKVQHLQFEDDDYYYYVKAVPKLDSPETENREIPEEEEDYYLD